MFKHIIINPLSPHVCSLTLYIYIYLDVRTHTAIFNALVHVFRVSTNCIK